MSTIRRQSIISSGFIYFGFALGALNTLLFTKVLTVDENGLVIGMFVSIGNIMFSLANLGMPSFINKFYPYYKSNLPPEKNDMMSLALFVTMITFVLVIVSGIVFKPLVIQKYGHNSQQLVHYYYWIFPFGLGLSLFTVLESYGWQVKRSILTNYLREFQWRSYNLILIVLLALGIFKSFDLFVKLYSFGYLLVTAILVIVLVRSKELHFTVTISRVTKRFWSKIKALIFLAWTANVMFNISFYFAQLVIAAVVPGGLAAVAVFTTGQFVASLVAAPQRGVAAAAIGPLSQAWRDKDHGRIARIYSRSSINQLIFSIGIFILIALNFRDGVLTLKLAPAYLAAQTVFIIIGLNRIIDMGTGLNVQIIGTSTYWRFDFITGMILVLLTVPLNYLLARRLGIVGPAIADILSFSLYNGIRCVFLYRKFGMQPFSKQTFYTLALGAIVYFAGEWLFRSFHGWMGMTLRSGAILLLYAGGVLALRLSDDVAPVWETVKKRLRITPK